jgi:hypothetical protein
MPKLSDEIMTRSGRLPIATIAALLSIMIVGGSLVSSSTIDTAELEPYFLDNWVPVGYQDTREDGIAAATEDIKNNKMMFAKYGAIEGLNYSKYSDIGIAPILLGCGVGGSGFTFWMAYNKTIIKEMQRRGYDFDVRGPI